MLSPVVNKIETITGYINNTQRTVNINVTSQQVYYVYVSAFNEYGTSALVMSGPVNVTTVVPPTTTTEPSMSIYPLYIRIYCISCTVLFIYIIIHTLYRYKVIHYNNCCISWWSYIGRGAYISHYMYMCLLY